MKFNKKSLAVSVAGSIGLLGLAGLAVAQLQSTDSVGTNQVDVTQALSDAGYQVLELEDEDGELEARVMLDGVEYEIEIDPVTGAILDIEAHEMDDDEHDDDDNEDDDDRDEHDKDHDSGKDADQDAQQMEHSANK